MKFLSADSVACLQTDLRLRHASPGSLESGQGLGDLGPDAKQDPGHIDRREILLGAPLPDPADVSDPTILKLPDRGHLEAGRAIVGTEARVWAAGEVARGQQARVCGRRS